MALTTSAVKSGPSGTHLRRIFRRVREGLDLEILGTIADLRPRSPREGIERELILAEIRYQLGQYSESKGHCLVALRLTRSTPELRPDVRCLLSKALIRTADLRRAERLIRRALVELHLLRHPDIGLKGFLLSNLGLIHRRTGFLTSAVRLQERALHFQTLAGQAPIETVLVRINLAVALANRGDFQRAESVLSQAVQACGGSTSGSPPTSGDLRRIELARAFMAVEERRWTECERALAKASGSPGSEITRSGWLVRQYAADLEIGRGRAAAAIPGLRALFREVRESSPSHEDLAGLALRLAAALHGAGLQDEGLEKALLAARLACRTDRREWAAGLRVAGLCLTALGRRNEAHRSFAEAMSVLDSTEFVTERKRLLEAMSECGFAIPDRGANESRSRAVPSGAPDRGLAALPLRDGRAFLTADRGLAVAIEHAARDRLPVFLVGETGTGKELVAHLIHDRGPRCNGPFVLVDCSTLPEGLVEAELFGATRGAYTGAVVSRDGLVAPADGGTLFLDELPELPLSLQSKLLRLVQDGTYRRVGEERLRRIQARVIAATNRDPHELMNAGALKSDLFYRLDGHHLVLPALRDQAGVFGAIANVLAKSVGLSGVSDRALARLRDRPWPGNFRQLEMFLRRVATASGSGEWIDEDDGPQAAEREAFGDDHALSGLRQTRRDAERERLRRAIEAHHGNRSAAARTLAISRQGLYKALRRTGLA